MMLGIINDFYGSNRIIRFTLVSIGKFASQNQNMVVIENSLHSIFFNRNKNLKILFIFIINNTTEIENTIPDLI